ncbi:PEP-CTERM sorting domain-containing protein [Nitrosovibrio tenuis]|uniref:PEP-CTERM protein-sorting domain-containing protein n=1 Tax=Nitrosovibrio tenuis TaxID=1233 RepID=A0A1H7GPL9_9PROT|nr:PEP-CTERM sorting domain-containing protein [Nitrosovibrio tenuis]SEK39984.1 PEP-CTERM protein-sorting domain-containing protein [Nitrosovibrio tenuis]
MLRMTQITLAVAAALTAEAGLASAAQGPSSSADAYLQAVAPGVSFKSILTTGDSVGGYRMAGIPDGLGAYDNDNGTFTVLMNHELGNTAGVAHGPLSKGAFVSDWVIDKSTLQVVSGGDLIQNVYGWNTSTQSSDASATTGWSFNRFCSADMAQVSAFYNPASGLGTQSRLFLNGEEGGATGYAVATVATGANTGNAYILGKMNPSTNGSGGSAVGAWENLLANPYTQDKTIVIGNNDGGTGVLNNALAVYVGTKTNTGSEIDRAGLTNGVTKFVNVAGHADGTTANDELNNTTSRTTGIANGTHFTLSDTASTTFSRPEDGAWSADGTKFYFVTTDQLDTTDTAGGTQHGGTRLWSLTFDDITHPEAGGRIDVVFDSTTIANGLGNARPNMFDNISVNKDGTITLLEDVGNANHNGKVWQFDPESNTMTMLGKFDPALFGDVSSTGVFTAGSHTKDEETSGVIDITSILGKHDDHTYHLLVAQDHASASSLGLVDPTAMVEGGQLMLMATPVPEPETYAMFMAGLGLMGFLARRRKNGHA